MMQAVTRCPVVLAFIAHAGLTAAANGRTTLTTLRTAYPVQRDTREVTVATGVLITINADALEEIVPVEVIPDAVCERPVGDRLDVGAKLQTVGLSGTQAEKGEDERSPS